jgi:hypothetical protein
VMLESSLLATSPMLFPSTYELALHTLLQIYRRCSVLCCDFLVFFYFVAWQYICWRTVALWR